MTEWHYTIHVRYDHDDREKNPNGCARAMFVDHRGGKEYDTGPMDVITADGRVAEMGAVLESYLATGELDERDLDALRQAAEPLSPEPKYTAHECDYIARQRFLLAFESGDLSQEHEAMWMRAEDKGAIPLADIHEALAESGIEYPVYQAPDIDAPRPKPQLTPHERAYLARMAGVEGDEVEVEVEA